VAAFLLSAVGSTGWETGLYSPVSVCHFDLFLQGEAKRGVSYIALSADHLVAVELGGKRFERWLDNTTTETEHEMESRFLW